MKILIENEDGLIGDFLGSVPAMQALVKEHEVYVKYHPEITEIFKMTGLKSAAENVTGDWDKYLNSNCGAAFDYSQRHGALHMTQAFFGRLGLPVPDAPVKAELNFIKNKFGSQFDYIIAPFSRSLVRTGQLWQLKNWIELTKLMPDKQFLVIGNERDYLEANEFRGRSNVKVHTGYKFEIVFNLLLNAKHGLISVVSGPSHMAFHLGVKNFLLTNQGVKGWGVNPDAIKITNYILKLQPQTVVDILLRNEK